MRARSGSALVALVVLGAALVTRAEQPEPAPPPSGPSWRGAVWLDQWRGIPRSPALDVPAPITRDEEVQRVTLKEAIAIALENNPNIAAKRLDPARLGTRVLEAQSSFDPTLASEIGGNHQITPNANALSDRATSVIDDRYANFHLSKLLRSSTQLQFDFLNDRLDNNASYISLRPQYKPELRFSVVQPLLRDFGWDFSYLVVRVAERTADSAVYLYEADLADFVERVIRAYWRVVGARESVEATLEAKQLADRTVVENEARVRVGLFAPVAVLEAQADAARRDDNLITARNELDVARQQLAQLCFFRPANTFVPRTLEPAEEATPEDIRADVDQTLAIALVDRPEIHASALGVEARQINERVAGNGLLPRLDVVGGYGVNGLSGTGQIATATFISAVDVSTVDAATRCQLLGPGIYQCTRALAPPPLAGSRTDAYGSRGRDGGLLSGDFNAYTFGLRITVPLDNALAKSAHTRSQIELDQAELNHRGLLSQITLDVRQAVADVTTSRQRIDTARVATKLAEENLRNQEKRHEVGMATTKDLLDFQTRLTEARLAEVQAKFAHNIAVAAWRRAQGRLLAHYSIVVEHPGTRKTPWFARF
ncbi:MAG: TolC family protein [Candidatus Binatia bacterium]